MKGFKAAVGKQSQEGKERRSTQRGSRDHGIRQERYAFAGRSKCEREQY